MSDKQKNLRKQNVKTFFIMLIISIIFIVAGIILHSLVDTILGWIVGIVGGILVIASLVSLGSGSAQISRSFCHCGQQYNYQNDVSWQSISQKEKNGCLIETVEIVCTCPKCGYKQYIREKFTTADFNNLTVTWKYKNLDHLVRQYFL